MKNFAQHFTMNVLQKKLKLIVLQFKKIGRRSPHVRSRLAPERLSVARRKLLMVTILRYCALAAIGLTIIGILAFIGLFAWYSRQLPKPGEIVRRSGFSTKLYDRNGTLLYDLFDQERRTPITIDKVPEHVKQATVATEDKDFYKHKGFDALTFLRIPYNLLMRQRVVGGSTLTQQLVKNVFLTNERSVVRKFKELVLSLQIERTFTKDQILEMYLNEAPYGGTAWGIGTAAEVYFNKPVQDLTLVEGIILAGLPQSPTRYSPAAGRTDESGEFLWKIRAKGVLRRMKEDGYVTDLSYEQALGDLNTVQFQSGSTSMKAPHFVMYVRDVLSELFGEELIETAGLKVTTSVDLEEQDTAQRIVFEEIEKVKNVNITNGSVMVMNPKTGEIIAISTNGERPAQKNIGRIIERNTNEVPISGCCIIRPTGTITNNNALKNSKGLLRFLNPSSDEVMKFASASIVVIFANSDGCIPKLPTLNQLFER